MSKTICSNCGQNVTWIKTKSGNYNPCNLPLLKYSGNDDPMVISQSGRIGRLSIVNEGYICHYSTCLNLKRAR